MRHNWSLEVAEISVCGMTVECDCEIWKASGVEKVIVPAEQLSTMRFWCSD